MYRTRNDVANAAAQVRGIAASMSSLVGGLHAGGVWIGDDAARLQNDWAADVTDRLYRAASRMDQIVFSPVED